MKYEVSSETSAIRTQTPGNYPKRNKLHLEHGESLKTINAQRLFITYIYCISPTCFAVTFTIIREIICVRYRYIYEYKAAVVTS